MSPAELLEMQREWRADPFPLSGAVREENVLVRLSGQSKREVVIRSVPAISFPDLVNSAEVMSRIWERGLVAGTAAECGAAFLHTARWGRRAMHRADLVAVGRLASSVEFGALDGGPTDILLLFLASDARQHLILLAKAVQLCRRPGFLAAVRRAIAAASVLALVRDAERGLSASVSPAIPS